MKPEDLNIQIQYKLIEELRKTNENLQLKIRTEQEVSNQLKYSVNQLHLINEFAIIIQKARNTDEIVWSITENAVSKLGFEDCVIYLLDEKEKCMVQKAAYGHKNPKTREILNPIKIKIGEGIVGHVAKTGVSEIIKDTKKDKRYILDDIPRLSEITVPIVYEKKVIGIIDSENTDTDFFTKNHLENLTTIASMAGTKIIQTQLNKDLIEHQKNLEKIIQKRTSEIDEKNKDLEGKNELLNRMALFPAHNPNPVIELDLDFNVTYFNEACKKYPEIYSLIKKEHDQFEKHKNLFLHTIANKENGKHIIKEGFRTSNYHFGYNIYIDKENNFVRVYLSDVTKIIHLQEEITKQRDEIYDSLNYAKIIQRSILPDSTFFNDFFAEGFIYYQPKDIVSGDFYWAHKKNNHLYFALCDCTGHGVPGALLSMIGYDAMNHIINSGKTNTCAEFMNKLHDFFSIARKKGRMRFNDAMDMIVLKYDLANSILSFSGSKQKLMILRNQKIIEFDTDSISLGDDSKQGNYSFKEKEFALEKEDVIYTFTDGFIDQFGGQLGKKLKYPNFRNLLIEISQKQMSKQNEELTKFMENWMDLNSEDPYPQLDDMSIVGFKV